jgi:hypothetical protein
LQRDIRGWAARYGELKRDKEADAERSRYWPAAVEVFEYWQRVCKHPRSAWSAERFFLVEPFLKKHGDRDVQARRGRLRLRLLRDEAPQRVNAPP